MKVLSAQCANLFDGLVLPVARYADDAHQPFGVLLFQKINHVAVASNVMPIIQHDLDMSDFEEVKSPRVILAIGPEGGKSLAYLTFRYAKTQQRGSCCQRIFHIAGGRSFQGDGNILYPAENCCLAQVLRIQPALVRPDRVSTLH